MLQGKEHLPRRNRLNVTPMDTSYPVGQFAVTACRIGLNRPILQTGTACITVP